jgi:hypothetical protein
MAMTGNTFLPEKLEEILQLKALVKPAKQRKASSLQIHACRSSVLCYDDFVSLKNDLINLQWARGRPRDISTIEIVFPVVTGAPDDSHVFPILHCTLEVRADSRKRAQVTAGSTYQEAWLIPEPKNESTVFGDVLDLSDLDTTDFHFSCLRRFEVGEEGIK